MVDLEVDFLVGGGRVEVSVKKDELFLFSLFFHERKSSGKLMSVGIVVGGGGISPIFPVDSLQIYNI